MKKIILVLFFSIISITSMAHSGITDKSGCHHDKQNRVYHCHSNFKSIIFYINITNIFI